MAKFMVIIYIYGAGNGDPLQYSYLENPMDRGAWQAMVHRVAEGWTRLKRLSTHKHALSSWTCPTNSYISTFCFILTPLPLSLPPSKNSLSLFLSFRLKMPSALFLLSPYPNSTHPSSFSRSLILSQTMFSNDYTPLLIFLFNSHRI